MLLVLEVARLAQAESLRSSLPGYYDGPADAVRHLVLAAELRRRAGLAVANVFLYGNELPGLILGGESRPGTTMDLTNNSIGLGIGARARSYAEVVAMARTAIQAGIVEGGTGANGTPVWLPREDWDDPRLRAARPPPGPLVWQDRALGDGNYAHGGPEHAFMAGMTPREAEALLLRDLETVPPEAWSDEDVRAVIRSRPYQDSRDPTRGAWQERVRAHFDARIVHEKASVDGKESAPASSEEDNGGGGMVAVHAYTRRGEKGPVTVAAHQRSSPG